MLSLADPVVRSYIAYSAILTLKLLAVGFYTAKVRYGNKWSQKYIKIDKTEVDPDVERVRRAHLNDLENIPAFLLLSAIFLTTGPDAAWVTLLFRVYTAFRVIHTIVYAVTPLPQPTRFIAFFVPLMIKTYMGMKVVTYYIAAI